MISNEILNFIPDELNVGQLKPRVFSILYKSITSNHSIESLRTHPEFSDKLVDELITRFSDSRLKIKKVIESKDLTVKFLFELHDGLQIETVAIPFFSKYTICLSSQVGCAMKCNFCFTGDQGFKRNLEPFEIILQYIQAWNYLKSKMKHSKTPNVVYMGQGEPFQNFSNVKKSIEIFHCLPGIKLGPRQITLSTVGVLESLYRIDELIPVNLAISLHASNQFIRSEIIPYNKKSNISEIMTWVRSRDWNKKRKVNFEYLLLKNTNMTNQDAQEFADLLKGMKCIVNLIPFNPYPGSRFERPSEDEVEQFKSILVKNKIRTMVRRTKGDDILAACGQLANQSSDSHCL